MPSEKVIWSGTPSQVVNLGSFIFLTILSPLIFPIFIMIWKYLKVRSTKYILTEERLITKKGVFSLETDELELYRIRDYQYSQPFFLRIFSKGTITLITNDKTDSIVTLEAIPGGENLREQIRNLTEKCKNSKNVREVDVAYAEAA